MKPVVPLLALLLLSACTEGGTDGPCFPARRADILPVTDAHGGQQLVCSLDRIAPKRRAKYIERFPFLATDTAETSG